jgi:hypothetical protein
MGYLHELRIGGNFVFQGKLFYLNMLILKREVSYRHYNLIGIFFGEHEVKMVWGIYELFLFKLFEKKERDFLVP